MVRLLTLSCSALLLALTACGASESGGGGGGDDSDGRYYAPTNGVHMEEGVACETFRKAFADRALSAQCAITASVCPAFIRRQGGNDPSCRTYDEAAVKACAAYVKEQTECVLIADAPTHCVIKTYTCP